MNFITKTGNIWRDLLDYGRIFQTILLSIWIVFQYRRGNELYALFVFLLFFILSISRSKNLTLIIAPVLLIVLFRTPVLDTWIEIRKSNLDTFRSFKPSMSRLFTPNSGRDVLPKDVQQMLALLEENNLAEYRLSTMFEQDPLIHQRIVESAWPVKKDAMSPYLLSSVEEFKSMTSCVEVARKENVVLGYCP